MTMISPNPKVKRNKINQLSQPPGQAIPITITCKIIIFDQFSNYAYYNTLVLYYIYYILPCCFTPLILLHDVTSWEIIKEQECNIREAISYDLFNMTKNVL